MNSTMLRVTNRIIERSRDTRAAYLARINQPKPTPCIVRNWPAAIWLTDSRPAGLTTKASLKEHVAQQHCHHHLLQRHVVRSPAL